jgi:hypothetical protein
MAASITELRSVLTFNNEEYWVHSSFHGNSTITITLVNTRTGQRFVGNKEGMNAEGWQQTLSATNALIQHSTTPTELKYEVSGWYCMCTDTTDQLLEMLTNRVDFLSWQNEQQDLLIDTIHFDFGFRGFEPYGRDPFTCFSHPIVLGKDDVDYGLAVNGGTWTASSQHEHYGPNTLGTIGAPNNWMHFKGGGAKWFQWCIPTARRIKSIQFHCGGNTTYNGDFMKRVIITLRRGNRVIKTLFHTFKPVTDLNPTLGNFALLEKIKL